MTALAITAVVIGVAFALSLAFHAGAMWQARRTRQAYARIVNVAQGSLRGYETRQR